MFDPTRRFETTEWRRVEQWLDEVYDDFTPRPPPTGSCPYEHLEPLARGRVWTGADARERGLVDPLGGLDHAWAAPRDRIGYERDSVRVQRVPHPSPLERLRPPTPATPPPRGCGAAPARPRGWPSTSCASSATRRPAC